MTEERIDCAYVQLKQLPVLEAFISSIKSRGATMQDLDTFEKDCERSYFTLNSFDTFKADYDE